MAILGCYSHYGQVEGFMVSKIPKGVGSGLLSSTEPSILCSFVTEEKK